MLHILQSLAVKREHDSLLAFPLLFLARLVRALLKIVDHFYCPCRI